MNIWIKINSIKLATNLEIFRFHEDIMQSNVILFIFIMIIITMWRNCMQLSLEVVGKIFWLLKTIPFNYLTKDKNTRSTNCKFGGLLFWSNFLKTITILHWSTKTTIKFPVSTLKNIFCRLYVALGSWTVVFHLYLSIEIHSIKHGKN